MGKLVAEKLGAMKADEEAVQAAISSPDHTFWDDLAKHFGQKVKKIFSRFKTVTVGAVTAKKTADCFTDKTRYFFRDGDLDKFLPKHQSDQAESRFGVLQLTEPATFKKFVENVLGTKGSLQTLAKLLKERSLTTTLPAIETLIERQENGDDVGLRTDGWANFFFVENEDGDSVSVVYVCRRGRQWDVYQSSCGGGSGWGADARFFLRNFSGD